jgi:hypothetical protein
VLYLTVKLVACIIIPYSGISGDVLPTVIAVSTVHYIHMVWMSWRHLAVPRQVQNEYMYKRGQKLTLTLRLHYVPLISLLYNIFTLKYKEKCNLCPKMRYFSGDLEPFLK